MEADKVYRHLDTDCPGQIIPQPVQPKPKTFGFSTARSTIKTPAAAATTHLPVLNFTLLNETKLRKKLNDIGIPAHGNRQAMEKRYKEWAMMWNANCDSSRPKTRQELLRDLDVWERTQGSLAPTSSHAANLGAQIKDKNFDGTGWSTKHSDSFKDLIANARKSRPVKSAETAPKPPEEVQPAEEMPATSTISEASENAELHSNNPDGKPLPILGTQPQAIPVGSSVAIHLTSPTRGQMNGGSIPPG